MEIKYRNLLKEWGLTLESDVLDPAFVQKATEFETKVNNNELSDEEIKTWDNDLVNCFNDLHNFSEEENPETKEAKHGKEVAEAKNEVAEAETLEALKALESKFAHLPELTDFIQKRIVKVQKAIETKQNDDFNAEALADLQESDYDSLPALLEKYKDHPKIVAAIQARIEKEKPEDPHATLRNKLAGAKKREWTYEDLRAIGINPTGNDMEVEGVYLERQYMFKIYKITRVDGKKV